jgi:signal transduction histidine kinase
VLGYSPQVLAGLTTLLGFTVLFGWFTGNVSLTKVDPAFVPMQFNTALGFLLCGTGLFALCFGWYRTAAILGILLVALGALTLIEYLLGVQIGIDELFMKHPHDPLTSHPGRMAPNTALCFLLSGSSLIFGMVEYHRTSKGSMIALLSALTLGLGTVSFYGYFAGVETAYGWGNLTRMALHTAAGFIGFGAGLIAWVWTRVHPTPGMIPHWFPQVAAVACVCITVCLWQSFYARDNLQIKNRVLQAEQSAGKLIEHEIKVQVHAIERMARRWSGPGEKSREMWMEDAGNYIKHITGMLAMAWIEPSGNSRWLAGSSPVAESTSLYSQFAPIVRQYFHEARNQRETTLSSVVGNAQKESKFFVLVPIFKEERFLGIISGVMDLNSILDALLKDFVRGFELKLYEDGNLIYERGEGTMAELFNARGKLHLRNLAWNTSIGMSAKSLRSEGSLLPTMALVTGIFISMLFFWALRTLRRSEYLARELLTANHDLGTLSTELKRSNKDLNDFAKIAAHDLKAPIRLICGFSGLLEKNHREELSQDGKEFLDHIKIAASDMQNLVSSILELAGVGGANRPFESVDLGKLVKEAAKLREIQLEETGGEIEIGVLPTVFGDPIQLKQIFQNLIGNAIKYVHEGVAPKILIKGKTEDVSQSHDGLNQKFHVISIEDNGIGFNPEDTEEIFLPFRRLVSSSEYEGSGIGLATVKRIVERHQGTIKAQSIPGKGSTFELRLPCRGS